jgi:hypothetical protein
MPVDAAVTLGRELHDRPIDLGIAAVIREDGLAVGDEPQIAEGTCKRMVAVNVGEVSRRQAADVLGVNDDQARVDYPPLDHASPVGEAVKRVGVGGTVEAEIAGVWSRCGKRYKGIPAPRADLDHAIGPHVGANAGLVEVVIFDCLVELKPVMRPPSVGEGLRDLSPKRG